MNNFKIVNCAEMPSQGDEIFLENKIQDPKIEWSFFENAATNRTESVLQKIKLLRFYVCWQTVLKAKQTQADCIITHLPRVTCWTAFFANLLNINTPHLAFSFNFTDLPTGLRRKIMTYAFQKVDRFVVYSTAEKKLYTDYFKIPSERIDFLPWAMQTPSSPTNEPLIKGDYICAVGGEGRDYGSLVQAMVDLPNIPLAIVCRPHSLNGLSLPSNVQVFTNLSVNDYWNIVQFSKFSVIPLRDKETNCGHISIVGSLLLGKPLVTTFSDGTIDYVFPDKNALVSPPQNPEYLKENIYKLWTDSLLYERLSETTLDIAKEKYHYTVWVNYLKNYLQKLK